MLDAGTGLRKLGDRLMAEGRPVEATVLLSHLHWDHIQGLPFFVPAYVPSTKLRVVGAHGGVMSLGDVLARQMTAPMFPVRYDDLGAEIRLEEVRAGQTFDIGEARVTVAKLNHPGGVFAYRVEHEGRSVVYATDTEHYACIDPALRALCEYALANPAVGFAALPRSDARAALATITETMSGFQLDVRLEPL